MGTTVAPERVDRIRTRASTVSTPGCGWRRACAYQDERRGMVSSSSAAIPRAGAAVRSAMRWKVSCAGCSRPVGGEVPGGQAWVGADDVEPLADQTQPVADRVAGAGVEPGGPVLVEVGVPGGDAVQVPGVADHQADVGRVVGRGVEDLDVGGEAEFGDDAGDVDVTGCDPQAAVQRAEARPGEPGAQVVTLALPGLGEGEAEEGPGAVPVVVDGAGVPQALASVPEDLGGLRGEAEVHATSLALALQQTAVDHTGEGGAHGLLADSGPGEDVDDAARVHAQRPLVQNVVAEEGEHERLGAQLRSAGGVDGGLPEFFVHVDQGTVARRSPRGRPGVSRGRGRRGGRGHRDAGRTRGGSARSGRACWGRPRWRGR